MKSILHPARFASLCLSLFLQVAPLVRLAVADTAAVLSPVVALLRWAVGAAAVAGSFHAVSGATGITITQGSTTTKSPKGTNGVAMGLRVSITSTAHGTAKSYKASGLPTGLAMTSSTQGVISGTPSVSGTFTAKITGYQNSNQTGDNASFNVTMTIVNGPPAITTHPQPLTVDAGLSASLSVVATGSGLTYRWIKGGVELPVTVPGATNATLTFNPAKAADSGSYQVRVTNSGGSVLSSAAVLTVNAVAVNPPVVGTPPENATVAVGGTATFTVDATGAGTLTYQWSKAGVALDGQTSPTLTISPVAVDSGGSYTVRVTNAGGSVESSAVLTVAPTIAAQSVGTQVVHTGEAVRLSVTALGPAPLTYVWHHNGTPIANADQSQLLLDPATSDDSGAYFVTVSSPGASTDSAAVSVDIRPLTIAPPTLNDGSMSLEWTAIPGRTYRVHSNSTLSGGTWNSASDVTPATATGALTLPVNADVLFFQIVPQ